MSDRSDHVFDKRIVERNIKKGLITRKQYEERLAALPDVEGNAEYVATEAGHAHGRSDHDDSGDE
jgi:hypothetical protein